MAARRRTNTASIFIRSLDPTVMKEEVINPIAKTLRVVNNYVTVPAMKMGRFDETTTEIQLPCTAANNLLKTDSIKIGWIDCSVTEKVRIARCYKSLEYGHSAMT